MTGHDNIVVITQARMTSSRLPGKVLKEVGGKSLLEHHITRLQSNRWQTVIATTVNDTDDPIISWAESHAIKTFRGSEHNVLERFFQAAHYYHADILVRVTSDCPFIDSGLIAQGIDLYMQHAASGVYVSNCFPRTFARGFDFEIFSFAALEDAYKNASELFDQEHVTPYIWKNKSGKIHLKNITQAEDCSDLRICVDTPEDFELIKILIEEYHCNTKSQLEIEQLLRQHPQLVAINAHIEQKKL